MLGWSPLLVEGGSLGAVDKALEDEWAAGDATQGAGGDGEVVADEVELGEARLAGEVELPGMRDDDGLSVDGQNLAVLLGRHGGWMRQPQNLCTNLALATTLVTNCSGAMTTCT